MKKLILFSRNPEQIVKDGLLLESIVSVVCAEPGEEENFSYSYIGDLSFKEVFEQFKNEISEKQIKSYLVIPGEQSTNYILKVPGKASRQIQKALPFLVEDQIATEPDNCFIAPGEQQGTQLPCTIIERALLEKYVEFLEEHQLHCERIISFNNLPFDTEDAIHVFGDFLLLSTKSGERYSFNIELLGVFLSKLPGQENNALALEAEDEGDEQITSDELESDQYLNPDLPVYIYLENEDGTEDLTKQVMAIIEDYSKTHDFPFQTAIIKKETHVFYEEQAKQISKRAVDKRLLNFRQGEYKSKQHKETSFSLNVNWKPAAYLLAVLIFMSLFSIVLDTHRYRHAAEVAKDQTKDVFKQIFPTTKNYTQMKRRVSDLMGVAPVSGNEFITLMVGFSNGMSVINSKSPDSLKATRFQYDQSSSELKIDILAANFDTLNELKSFLGKSGFILEIGSTSTQDSGVKGRLNLSMSGN